MRTKIGFLGLVIAGLVIGSVVSNNAVRADATTTPVKHHHRHHRIHGKIESVAGEGSSISSITIKVHHHHKKGSTVTTPTTEEKTINVDSSTKVEIVNADGTKTTGSLSDLMVKKHVSVAESKDLATEITVGHAKHHHKKKPAA